VLEALFEQGPTPDRVRAALPSLILVAAVVAIRAGLQAAAGWAQSRLHPQVDRVVEIRLLDLTTRVELAAFDDAEFYDAMQRARDRGYTRRSGSCWPSAHCRSPPRVPRSWPSGPRSHP
jgi:ATP-binding cassette subfamily B protein/ATP-binding cassette subfamily C protein